MLSRKPAAGTHWTIREAARASGISKSTVHRLFQTFALQSLTTRNSSIRTSKKKWVWRPHS
jgi:putative transposase